MTTVQRVVDDILSLSAASSAAFAVSYLRIADVALQIESDAEAG